LVVILLKIKISINLKCRVDIMLVRTNYASVVILYLLYLGEGECHIEEIAFSMSKDYFNANDEGTILQ